MEVTLESQIIVIFYSIVFGAFLGGVYHLLTIVSNVFSFKEFEINNQKLSNFKKTYNESIKTRAGLFFVDILYFLVITPVSAIFIFGINSGVLRGYIIAGGFFGYILYRVSFGRLFKAPVNYISLFIQIVFVYSFKFIKKFFKAFKSKFKRKAKRMKISRQSLVIFGKNEEQG